jgi:hypothetical protein
VNLAIVITASQYKPPQINLPACECDADLMTALVEGAIEFDERLILRNISDSAIVKK